MPNNYQDDLYLAEFAGAAVVANFRTGAVVRLNHPAARMVRALIRDGRAALASGHLSGEGVETTAEQWSAVAAAVEQAPAGGGAAYPRFAPAVGGYTMADAGGPVLWLAADGGTVRTGPGRGATAQDLLWAVPHILGLAGLRVLHGSAVTTGAGVVALLAGSGVGKTTLARLLSVAGFGRLVSEDLVLIGDDMLSVPLLGEARCRDWAVRACEILRSGGHLLADGVADFYEAPCLPLSRLYFLGRSHLPASELRFEPVEPLDAFIRLLSNSFGETHDIALWRRTAAIAERLANAGVCQTLTVPDGLPALERAVERYTRKTTS